MHVAFDEAGYMLPKLNQSLIQQKLQLSQNNRNDNALEIELDAPMASQASNTTIESHLLDGL